METVFNTKYKLVEKSIVALGNFDGIHIGHKVLIDKMKEQANTFNLKSIVFTFRNHPLSILQPNNNNKRIMNNEYKISLLNNLDIDMLYMIKFNKSIMNLSPEEFVKQILLQKLNASIVVVGFNYNFGYKGIGTVKKLKLLGRKYNFKVIIVPPVKINEKIVSSTYIRKLISLGNIKKANLLLSRPYRISGKVIKGSSRGKILGYPTANIAYDNNYIIPKFGVYETKTIIDHNSFKSITNVGNNPTFNGNNISIETHIINFNKDVYGHNIKIDFLNFIRKEKKFDNKQNLIEQIKKDVSIITN